MLINVAGKKKCTAHYVSVLLKMMEVTETGVTLKALTASIKAFKLLKQYDELDQMLTKILHQDNESVKLKLDSHLYHSAIVAYIEFDQIAKAIDVFSLMKSRGAECTVWIYNTLLNVFASQGSEEGAENWMKAMLSDSIAPDLITLNTLLKVYAQTGNVSKARSVYAMYSKYNLKPNVLTINTLIQVHAKAGDVPQVEHLLATEFAAHDLLPNIQSYNTALSSLCHSAESRPSDANAINRIYAQLQGKMSSIGLIPTAETYSIIVAALLRHGKLSEATDLVNMLQKTNQTMSLGSLGPFVTACYKNGNYQQALDAFEHFYEDAHSAKPSSKLCHTLILACTQLKNVEYIMKLLSRMEKWKVAPDEVIYRSIIKLGNTMQRWDLVDDIKKRMKAANIPLVPRVKK
jgi:pentatricopeptide repeat protein